MSNFPLFPPANVVNVVFWRESSLKNGKPILSIDEVELLNFLQENGFGRHSWGEFGETFIARQANGSISRVSIEQVRDFVRDYVSNLEDEIAVSFKKKDLQQLLINKTSFFSKNKLSWLKPLKNWGAS